MKPKINLKALNGLKFGYTASNREAAAQVVISKLAGAGVAGAAELASGLKSGKYSPDEILQLSTAANRAGYQSGDVGVTMDSVSWSGGRISTTPGLITPGADNRNVHGIARAHANCQNGAVYDVRLPVTLTAGAGSAGLIAAGVAKEGVSRILGWHVRFSQPELSRVTVTGAVTVAGFTNELDTTSAIGAPELDASFNVQFDSVSEELIVLYARDVRGQLEAIGAYTNFTSTTGVSQDSTVSFSGFNAPNVTITATPLTVGQAHLYNYLNGAL